MPKYKATAYIRLSYTDDRSSESDSVANQRKLIENFVERKALCSVAAAAMRCPVHFRKQRAIFAAIPRQTNPSTAIMRHTTPPNWNRAFSC